MEAVRWAECLLLLGVPQRYLLRCYPAGAHPREPGVDIVAQRELLTASRRVFDAVAIGDEVGLIVAREREAFGQFAFRPALRERRFSRSPWLGRRELATTECVR